MQIGPSVLTGDKGVEVPGVLIGSGFEALCGEGQDGVNTVYLSMRTAACEVPKCAHGGQRSGRTRVLSLANGGASCRGHVHVVIKVWGA